MLAGKVFGLGFKIISKLESYFLMTVLIIDTLEYKVMILKGKYNPS